MDIKQKELAELLAERLTALARQDRRAITRLVGRRVACRDKLADQPNVRTVDVGYGPQIGLLGVLNGILGVGEYVITAKFNRCDEVVSFESCKFSDLNPIAE